MSQASDKPSGISAKPENIIQGRVVSLDVFRGITIALMILVNNPGGAPYYPVLQHAVWNGLTLADVVFPFFLFIVGVAIPYSFAARMDRGETRGKILLRVARRTTILFAIGIIINGFPYFDVSTLRIMGVLQRVALCYFAASLIFTKFNRKKQIFVAAFLVLFYWAIMTLVPVPGFGAGVLEKNGNLAAYVDNALLGGGHLWGPAGTWDPEGLLSTIPAVATTLIGVVAGDYLRSDRTSRTMLKNLLFSGALLTVIGIFWNLSFPINKSLWTSSYVALTGGMALFSFAACHYLVDVRKHERWTKPFTILGLNAITVYVLSEIAGLILIYANVMTTDGKIVALRTLIYENYFVPWAGALNGSLFYALAFLLVLLGVMALFYKMRFFIHI